MIELANLTKKYKERTILDGITATFNRGEAVSLVGPSGGGKSTLLRCLNGLESFDGGVLKVAGVELQPGASPINKSALAIVRSKVGFVFQQWHLFAHMTAVQNVIEAPVHVKHENRSDAITHAKELLAKVGMSHRENAFPAELSGGEQQRVAIARALAMRPEVLLLDEPTSALDPERVGDVVELLSKLKELGLTLLIVTHEMRFAKEISNRIVVLHGGKIIEDGTPVEVLEQPKHERTRAFLGLDR